MRVAAVYDIHGNLPALDAVLTEAEATRIDLIVVGGDFVMGPMPRLTLERLRALGSRVRFIRGNTERDLLGGMADNPKVCPTRGTPVLTGPSLDQESS